MNNGTDHGNGWGTPRERSSIDPSMLASAGPRRPAGPPRGQNGAPPQGRYTPPPQGQPYTPSPQGQPYTPSPQGQRYTPPPQGQQYAAPPQGQYTAPPQTESPRQLPRERQTTHAGTSAGAPRQRMAAADGEDGGRERPADLSERRREAREEQLTGAMEKKRRTRRSLADLAATFLCLLLIISAAALTVFLAVLTFPRGREKSELPDKLRYVINGEGRWITTSDQCYDGKLYLDFSEIARYCGVSVSGEGDELTFFTAEGEALEVTAGSKFVFVNGTAVEMEGEAVLRGKGTDDPVVWLPFSFISTYVTGIDVTEEKERITISRVMLTMDTGLYPATEPQTVEFLLKPDVTLKKIPDGSLPPQVITMPDGTPTYEFLSDLSSFAKYMDPADRDAYLVMFNPSSPDNGSYVPTDLIPVLNARKGRDGLEMRQCAEKSLEALYIEMYAAGYTDVTVTMGYRSFAAQEKQFNIYLANERLYYRYNFASTGKYFSDTAYAVLGKEYLTKTYINKQKYDLSMDDARRVASSYSAYPGTGDHQTGLSCDMHNLKSASTEFSKTEVYTWLTENAYKFGFVERYPKGKEKTTGFSWEPYHWRFVGQYHASVMHDSGMCLEEYAAALGR